MPVTPVPGGYRHQADVDLANMAFDILKNSAVSGVAGKINAIVGPFKKSTTPQGLILLMRIYA